MAGQCCPHASSIGIAAVLCEYNLIRIHVHHRLIPRQRIGVAGEVLEPIGTPDARQVLETLAGGVAGARLTQQAKKSLPRLAA
jgi:hypothetical protein